MRMVMHECNKALTSPILLALVLVFTIFNIFLIVSQSERREELEVLNQLAGTYGVQITDESMKQFQRDLQLDLDRLNQLAVHAENQRFDSVYNYLETLGYEDFARHSAEEQRFIVDLQLKEMYYSLAMGIDRRYNQVDWIQIGEEEIAKFGLSGGIAEHYRNVYAQLAERVEEIQQSNEHKSWFFAGESYRMHSFLFRTLFVSMGFEALIITVLATALITNYEFENRTHAVAYATKKGRRLMRTKLLSSLITAAGVTLFLFSITLAVYFSIFDYANLWSGSIGSALNWEYKLPYVPWWKLTVLSFLLWSFALVMTCILLFNVLTFVISVFVKNNYFTFFLSAACFALPLILPMFMPAFLGLNVLAQFNLPQLTLNPHMFFMGSASIPASLPDYELITVMSWAVMMCTLTWLAFNKFRTQDIH